MTDFILKKGLKIVLSVKVKGKGHPEGSKVHPRVWVSQKIVGENRRLGHTECGEELLGENMTRPGIGITLAALKLHLKSC